MVHLAKDLCRSCRDEEEEEMVLRILGTGPALFQRRKRQLSAYYIDELSDLSNIDFGSLRRF